MAQKNHPNPAPDDHEFKAMAEELINQQSTMTLATAKGNVAWVVPVYYVFFESAFSFFPIPNQGTSRRPQRMKRHLPLFTQPFLSGGSGVCR